MLDLEQLIYGAIDYIPIDEDMKRFVIYMVIRRIRISRKCIEYKDNSTN
ncbi:MAG: hypothetical protein LUG60_12715 [Erysipelotrichaceae bacterium]|nr:hypothetical protein [Erysipelotrichaceae bacterium]